MEIQNISGPDIIPEGFSRESRVEHKPVEQDQEKETSRDVHEEGKGNYIDTRA